MKMSRTGFVAWVLRTVRWEIRDYFCLYPDSYVYLTYDFGSNRVLVDDHQSDDAFACVYFDRSFTPYQLYMSIRDDVIVAASGWLYKEYLNF